MIGIGRIRAGLAVKLLGIAGIVFTGAVAVTTMRASSELSRDLTIVQRSKGKAIALGIAAAAERSVKGDPLVLSNTIEANLKLQDVSYVYVSDPSGKAYASSFIGSFPDALTEHNVTVSETPSEEYRDVSFTDGGNLIRATDVSVPVARGTLGTAHVGMNRDAIDAQVSELTASTTRWSGLIVIVGLVVLFAGIVTTVIRPVAELTRVTTEILQRGDLTQTIRVRSNDEIGQLASTFSQMVVRLRDVPSAIRDSTRLLASSVESLDSVAADQGRLVTRQAAALQQTQTTAREIQQTSAMAAQKTEVILRDTERAEVVSRTGEAAVTESLSALATIRDQVAEISDCINQLSERTMQIGAITQTVKDLADQSNMLALNAAIEAVRSGEHGKSFAVVAREMRSLADQSIAGTKQVRQLLDEISMAVGRAVAITDKGVQRIDAGLAQVRMSGQQLSELSRIVQANSAAVRQIGASVSQQNAGIAQIFSAVTDQNEMMEDAVTALKATTTSIDTMKTISERQVTIVEQFKV